MIPDILMLILAVSGTAGILLILERGDALMSWLREKLRLVPVGTFRAERRLWR